MTEKDNAKVNSEKGNWGGGAEKKRKAEDKFQKRKRGICSSNSFFYFYKLRTCTHFH